MKRSQQQQTQSTSIGSVPAGSATKSRRGFTLVELLVVISIIGILIGMLAVSIGPVLTRVHEGANTVEMKQLELAIENFNNQYGFYPPTFSPNGGIANPGQLLPFLNKISPNHRENAAFPGGTTPRLNVWWNAIGQHLDERSSLVFWLTGLSSNKQFPITGNLPLVNNDMNAQLPVIYGGSTAIVVDLTGSFVSGPAQIAGGATDLPRDSFFDFKSGQLDTEALDIATPSSQVSADDRTHVSLAPGLQIYNTPFGNKAGNRGNEYLYRSSGSYTTGGGGFHTVDSGNTLFINPNTFQLFTYGRDGIAANIALGNSTDENALEKTAQNRDNLTNFANGRLETFDWRANLGL